LQVVMVVVKRVEPGRTGGKAEGQRFERRHELVHRVLRANIIKGHFPSGLVLLEVPLAEMLQTSRAPVQRALQELERDKLVHKFDGRGYQVGSPTKAMEPVRIDLRELGLIVSDEMDDALQTRGSWEWILDDLEQAVSSCLAFGEFRMIEAEVAAHFNVSRTVIRDVLGRLQERGLLRKTQSSRWIAGPLTAHALKECYDLRGILEPAALVAAAPTIDPDQLFALRDQTLSTTGDVAPLETELFARFAALCLLATPNRTLASVVRQNMSLLDAANRSLAQLGLPEDNGAVNELRVTLDLMLNGSIAAAAEVWRDHLKAACRRSVAQLKIVAIIERPKTIPPYLVAL